MTSFLIGVFVFLQQASPSNHFVELRGHKFSVDLATTEAEWMKGLMFREKLGRRQGMLFVGKFERPQSFWMKNTYVPLDIVFISKDCRVVSIQKNAVPLSLDPRPSEGPAQHVLEILGGESDKIGLTAGDIVKTSVEGLKCGVGKKGR